MFGVTLQRAYDTTKTLELDCLCYIILSIQVACTLQARAQLIIALVQSVSQICCALCCGCKTKHASAESKWFFTSAGEIKTAFHKADGIDSQVTD